MKRAAVLMALVALSACESNLSGHPSAKEVLTALDRPWIGRAGIEQQFFNDEAIEDAVLSGICTATPEWLEVAHRLFETSNAHLGEELASALAVALIRRPEAVLGKFEYRYVCSEPDDLPGACSVPHWRVAASDALQKIRDPALAVVKEKCAVDVARSVGLQSIQESK